MSASSRVQSTLDKISTDEQSDTVIISVTNGCTLISTDLSEHILSIDIITINLQQSIQFTEVQTTANKIFCFV